MNPQNADRCATCDEILAGTYCVRCGEKQVLEHDLSLRGFLRHTFETVTTLDSRGVRSLRFVMTRPGFLTAEYVAGRRRLYLSPLQIFLIVNVLFFFAAAFLPVVTLDTPLNVHLNHSSYREMAREKVRERFISQDSVDFIVFQTRFDYAAGQQAKSLIIIFVPFIALGIALLRIGRREPAGKHVAFALHYLSFTFLFSIFLGVGILIVRWASSGNLLRGDSDFLALVVLLSLISYLAPAFRTAYGSGKLAALVQAVVVALLFMPVLTIYRMILFFTVFYSV